MVEALRKAGVKLPEPSETPQQDAKQPSQAPHRTSGSDDVAATTTMSRRGDAEVEETQQSTSGSSESPNGDSKRRPSRPRKRVSFANGTKEEVNHTPKSRSPQERPPDEIARIIKEILDQHYADVREAIPPPDLRDGKLAVEYGKKMNQLEKAKEKRLKAAKVYQQWKRGFLEEIERDKEDSSREESAAAILEPDKNITSMDELQRETDVPVTSELIINGEATRSDVIAVGEGSKGRSNSRQHTPTRNAPSDTTSTSKEPITNNPFDAVVPINESPEDAALRRQMIQYNMDEVGAIVAELNLDEDKDEDFSEDYSDEERDDGSSVEDDEDHFGRTKQRVVNDDYLAEMEALQRKLKNVGPDLGKAIPSMPNETGKEQQRPNGKLANGIPGGSKPTAKKGVRFAEELDVQEAPLAITTNGSKSGNEPKVPPKTGLKPVLASVIERPYTASTAPDAAPEPDEYNPALVQKEVATEYHKMRNLMIQRQGGFMAQENEQAEVPLTEAEGGPKKVSRFKAARLGRV